LQARRICGDRLEQRVAFGGERGASLAQHRERERGQDQPGGPGSRCGARVAPAHALATPPRSRGRACSWHDPAPLEAIEVAPNRRDSGWSSQSTTHSPTLSRAGTYPRLELEALNRANLKLGRRSCHFNRGKLLIATQ